jgi:hypothetical protein
MEELHASQQPLWSQLHQLVETVSTNGERVESLREAVHDFRALKPADQTRLLLEVNVALLALQEVSLLIKSLTPGSPNQFTTCDCQGVSRLRRSPISIFRHRLPRQWPA